MHDFRTYNIIELGVETAKQRAILGRKRRW
jgi:hypothetical protein